MAGQSVANPHITEPTTDLHTLSKQALRRYGDFAPDSADGQTFLMFIEFANQIINDIRVHPYWPQNTPLDYYTSITDTRPIPDRVVIAGLLFHYALQQFSEKAKTYGPLYFSTLNQALYEALYGNAPIRVEVMDGGSRGGRS
jgi:hypothetical protein